MTRRVRPAELMVPAAAWNEPQPDWLPWHVARFCFLPYFVDPATSFAMELKLLASSLTQAAACQLSYDTRHTDTVGITKGALRLTICATDNWWSILGEEGSRDRLCGLPEEFFDRQARTSSRIFSSEFAEDANILFDLGAKLWATMQSGFRAALREGSAQVYGRWRLVDADFRRVHKDQLFELEPNIWTDGEHWLSDFDVRSELRSGSDASLRVFTPHIAFLQSNVRSKGNENERRAAAALAAEMRANADTPIAKHVLEGKYRDKFGISLTGFRERVWPDASIMAGRPWKRPGPRGETD